MLDIIEGYTPQPVLVTDNLWDDLGIDSMDRMELLAEIEVALDCDISSVEGEAVETVGELVDLVEKKVAEL